jgi:Ca2+-transporting ATPase
VEIGAPRIRHMPPQTRPNSSGMGYERKRVGSDTTAASSSSSFVRHHAFASMHDQPRSASPPASTYFPLLSGDSGARLRPTADAESHFAYSTTLRRHGADGSPISPIDIAHAVNAEASSLWTRAVSVVTGQPLEANLENGRVTPPPMQEQLRDTMSARFAHCSIEVSDGTSVWVPVLVESWATDPRRRELVEAEHGVCLRRGYFSIPCFPPQNLFDYNIST